MKSSDYINKSCHALCLYASITVCLCAFRMCLYVRMYSYVRSVTFVKIQKKGAIDENESVVDFLSTFHPQKNP